MLTIHEPPKENLFFHAPEFDSYPVAIELPEDLKAGFADITAEIEKERAASHAKMEGLFIKAQEAMKKAAPKVDLSAFAVDVTKRIDELNKQHTDAMAAVTEGLTEVDKLRDVMKLQNKVMNGASLSSLVDKLEQPRELIALIDLAEQNGDESTQQRALNKLAQLVSGNTLNEIQKLQVALRAITVTERKYNDYWNVLIDDLGLVRRY